MHDYSINAQLRNIQLHYRPDIDGLRAIAVLPVVLFHLGSPFFSGGFVGVDVFFVISGYLVTGMIAPEIGKRQFSILGFYERRARRIFPALFATMLAVTVAGLILFMPDELRDTGAGLVGVAALASNILFWQQVDYFNGAAELKPLIHTWSLSLEEQFYLFFPLVLIAAGRFAPGRSPLVVATLAVISFTIGILLLRVAPEANYYLLPTRAWELLIGAALAVRCIPAIHSKTIAEVVAWTGLAAIFGSAILLGPDSPFPGYNALWPCLGAAGLIHANTGYVTSAGRMLGLKPFVWIGLISYSLYLVHWPLIVFTGYVLLRPLTASESALLFAATIVLAALFWYFVERPFRNRHKISRRTVFTMSAAGLAAFGIVGAALFAADGLPQRYPGLEAAAMRNADVPRQGPKCFLKSDFAEWAGEDCFLIRSPGAPVTLLWGDSHANHYRRAIASAQPSLDANILLYTSAECLPVLHHSGTPRAYCAANNANVLNLVKRYNVSRVILAGYWEWTMEHTDMPFSDISDTVNRLRELGIEVNIIGDNPDFAFANPQFLAHRLRKQPDAPFYMAARNHRIINDRLLRLVDSDAFFDPTSALCRGQKCLVYESGDILMRDNAHLSPHGARKVVTAMRGFLER